VGVGTAWLVSLVYLWFRAPTKQRNEARKYVQGVEGEAAAIIRLRDACFGWSEEVEALLAQQQAKEPPWLGTALADAIKGRPLQTDDAKCERDRIQGETVALYIERHRERGLGLFDTLIAFHKIVDKGRPRFDAPRTPGQIEEAIDLMRTGAERL
jgi:hypothetical protein